MNGELRPGEDCRVAITRMHMFFDDELSSVESHQVQIHVEHCEGCEESFDVEEQMRALIRGCCQEQAPQSLMARLLQLHCECDGPPHP